MGWGRAQIRLYRDGAAAHIELLQERCSKVGQLQRQDGDAASALLLSQATVETYSGDQTRYEERFVKRLEEEHGWKETGRR